jgi:hypothetical protein
LGYNGLYFISILFGVVGALVGARLRAKFNKYSKIQLKNNLTGEEIALKMLEDHGIYNVKVISAQGQLTDHYNPTNHTVNLSESVFHQRNAAAAAVAAHECGHAVQHAESYKWLGMRSKLVPLVNISSSFVHYVVLAGVFLIDTFPALIQIGVVLFAIMALFAIITLPVEFDASKRALAWLKSTGTTNQAEYAMSKDALKWAALTYVVSALNAIANVIYLLMLLNGRKRS